MLKVPLEEVTLAVRQQEQAVEATMAKPELPPYKNTIYKPKAHVASTVAIFSLGSIHGHKKDILTPIIAIAI